MTESAQMALRQQADAEVWDEAEQADLLIRFIDGQAVRDSGIVERLRSYLAAEATRQNQLGRLKIRPWEFRAD
jgi:hypothetical protein